MTRIRSKILPVLGLLLLLGLWAQFSLQLVGQALMRAGWGLLPLSLLGLCWAMWDVVSIGKLLKSPRQWFRLLMMEWSSDGLSRLIPSAGLGGEPFRYRHLRPMTSEPGKLVLVYRIFHALTGLMATGVTAALCLWWGLSPQHPWGKLALVSALAVLAGSSALLWWRPWPRITLTLAIIPKMVSRFVQVSEVAILLILLGQLPTPERVLILQAYLAASASLFAFVPGGLGVQEAALVQGAIDCGLGAEVGFQIGLLRRCRQMMWAGWGLLAASWLEGTADAEKDSAEPGQNAPTDKPDGHQS